MVLFRFLLSVVLGISITLAVVSCSDSTKRLGTKGMNNSTVLQVSDGLVPVNQFRQIAMRGRVTTVCPDDGCWLVLTDNANVLRIELPNQMIPLSWAGHTLYAEGTIVEKIIDPLSPGYKEYEMSCGLPRTNTSLLMRRVPVFAATYMELAD